MNRISHVSINGICSMDGYSGMHLNKSLNRSSSICHLVPMPAKSSSVASLAGSR